MQYPGLNQFYFFYKLKIVKIYINAKIYENNIVVDLWFIVMAFRGIIRQLQNTFEFRVKKWFEPYFLEIFLFPN